jgi:vitamin B12 transporter
MTIFLCLVAAAAVPVPPRDIVVTAALAPVRSEVAPASVAIFDSDRIEALGTPFAMDLLRLAPGVAVSSSGGAGAQAQVRIRGAEANHTLLFIDGIDFDDVAADDQARFETFSAEGLDRIEVVRGPQSALWGSEALGGVIALATPDPIGPPHLTGSLEYGGHDQARGSATMMAGDTDGGVTATAAYLRGDGIDILGGGQGDRDGFENFTASVKGVARPGDRGEIGIVGRYIRHDNAYDGTDANFQRADTADASRAATWAVRSWARIGIDTGDAAATGASLMIDGQHLASTNRNRTGAVPVNDSDGRRTRVGATASYRAQIAGTSHGIDARVEREDEKFATRDHQFGGSGDQRLSRGRTAFVAEWRGDWAGRIVTDVAVRHDDFSRFRDATTLRAHAIVPIIGGIAAVGGYGEGIAQPGFAELFGFAANSGFVGNPRLLPERSRGYEAGLRYVGETVSAEIVAFSNRLQDEIVYSGLADFRYTYVNAEGTSRRRGIELSGEWRPLPGLRLNGNYTLIDAREPGLSGEARTPQEVRRPRHAASLSGDYRSGAVTLGGSIAYVGRRRDIDFDVFTPVRLDDYVLAGARIAYAVTGGIELFGRVDNAFDSVYQDVVGYATQGRTVYAGLRFRLDP